MTALPVARPLVSVIVVNYNGAQHLGMCFESLLATHYPPDCLELILVDGGSTDGSLELMVERFPQVVIVKAEANHYCAANNLGIRHARGEYLALLNNDTRVDPGWLEPIIALLEQRPEVGAAGSKILSMDGARIQSVGHAELPNYYWADRGYNEPDEGQYDRVEEVTSLTGAAVVYRRACLDQVGLLDEDFVMFVEDVDLGYRCRAKGWRLCVVPESRVYHALHGSITEEDARRWLERNRLLFVAKHHPEQLPIAWHGQGYYRPGVQPHADGRGAEALAAAVTKLVQEHGIARPATILPELFKALDQMVNAERHELVQRWRLQQATLEGQREAARTEVAERDHALVEQARRIKDLEDALDEAQAQAARLRQELMAIDRAVRRLLIVKAQRVPLAELEAWLREFRLRRPQARIGLLAHLVPDEFDRVVSSGLVDEPWLFCPGRRPFTWWRLAWMLPRLWCRRYDVVLVPSARVEDYAGFVRARRLARLTGSRRRRELPLMREEAVRLGEAVAGTSTVVPGQIAEYTIGLTNPSSLPQRVRLRMVWSRLLDDPHQQNEVSQLSAMLDVPPRTTKPVAVRYDWIGKLIVTSNGASVPVEQFRQIATPETTVYHIRIRLTDLCERRLDGCDLFQRIVAAG